MKAKLDCIPCLFNQAFRTARAATDDRILIRKILNKVGEKIKDIDLNLTPPEASLPIYKLVEEITGNEDPYKDIKKKHIKTALSLYPLMKKKVSASLDPLKEAVKIAIAGNAIDMGSTTENIDIKREFLRIEEGEFLLKDLELFRKRIQEEDEILYLSDNAGETVFDRPLVELLEDMGKNVIYAVKEKPIINDATREDALLSGIHSTIISTGSSIAGTVLEDCSDEFLSIFHSAHLIIAKGQGNYETLSDVKAPIFFLFKIKCRPISEDTGIPVGVMMLEKSKAK